MVRIGNGCTHLAYGKGIQNAVVDYIPKTFKISLFRGTQGHREKQN